MKSISSALFIIVSIATFGQTNLEIGDLAITGFNCDDTSSSSGTGFISINTTVENEFTFVLLNDINSGTSIRFTDNGWRSNASFRPDEGVLVWTASSDLSCGTEINITTGRLIVTLFGFITITDENFYNTSLGSLDSSNAANFDLGTNGDQILCYQGTEANPDFLFAINFNGNNWRAAGASNDTNSALPLGLTNGATAVSIQEIDNAEYNCTETSSIFNILAGITDSSNWLRDNTVVFSPLGGCQYNCDTCASTVVWDGVWSGTPDLGTEVIFESDYNTGSENIQACSITIDAGVTVTVVNSSFVEIQNDVTVNGNLVVETSGNFIQNRNRGSFTVGGTSTLNKTTPVKQEWFYYTYWSSPVANETIGNVFPLVGSNRRFSFNAANFVDNAPTDDVDDDGNVWESLGNGVSMIPGVGYLASGERVNSGLYPRADNVSFTGVFNTGDIDVPITFDPTNLGERWNLIGNPYPGAIDFVAFHLANSTVLDGAAYFWSQASPPLASNPGNDVLNLSQNDYAVFTVGTGGAAGGGPDTPNGYVASGQSFFIPALAIGTATFTNSMRVADGSSNNQFFKSANAKKSSASAINPLENRLWVNLTTDNGVFHQILVGYVDKATDSDDGLSYDAPKLLSPGFAAALYSNIENDDIKYMIQGKAINSISEDEIIKLGFISAISADTEFKLSIDQFQGAFLTDHTIYLKDNLLGTIHNLTDADYTFTSEPGEFNSRFEIVFNVQSLSTDDTSLDHNVLKIVQLDNDHVKFTVSNNLSIKSVRIFDLLGRELYNLKGNNSSETYNLSNLKDAIYIAKVELSNGAIITKKH